MTNNLNLMIETGPKGKKVVAIARDWPGLERGAKTGDAAIERLLAYVPRYEQIAVAAGLADDYPRELLVTVVEEVHGTGSTDFWGISFAMSNWDKERASTDDIEREIRLMQASWTFLDSIRDRVSPVMKKGPRGGGKDRDHIYRHVTLCEMDWAGGFGPKRDLEAPVTPERVAEHRAQYVEAIREYHAAGKSAKSWPLRYLIRHTAFHTLDHAWEMEDKDLTHAPE